MSLIEPSRRSIDVTNDQDRSATCVLPLLAGACDEPVPDEAPVPLCFGHIAQAWEYCQGRILRERLDRAAAEEADRSEAFVREFSEAMREIEEARVADNIDPEIDDPDSVVYYLRFADRIKIGFSRNLGNRLLAIPHDELLAIEPGGPAVERRRHQQFAQHRIVGEWFAASEDLRAHIAEIKAAEARRNRGHERMGKALKRLDLYLVPSRTDAELLGFKDPLAG